MTAYFPEQDHIRCEDGPISYRLSIKEADRILDVFQSAGAVKPFLALHDAYERAGGIPRVSCFRRFEVHPGSAAPSVNSAARRLEAQQEGV